MHPDLGLFCVFPEGWNTFNTPLFVGAVDEEYNRGMIYMGFADTNATPEKLGIECANRLKDKHNTIPDRSEKIMLNGLDAYLVSVIDHSGVEPVGIHNLWFKLNDYTFQVLGASYEAEYNLLEKCANSLRVLTEKEKWAIEVQVLRYAAANDGETIEEFSERTGNTWNPELTAVMNNIPSDKPLGKGQLVKYASKEKYVKK